MPCDSCDPYFVRRVDGVLERLTRTSGLDADIGDCYCRDCAIRYYGYIPKRPRRGDADALGQQQMLLDDDDSDGEMEDDA